MFCLRQKLIHSKLGLTWVLATLLLFLSVTSFCQTAELNDNSDSTEASISIENERSNTQLLAVITSPVLLVAHSIIFAGSSVNFLNSLRFLFKSESIALRGPPSFLA